MNDWEKALWREAKRREFPCLLYYMYWLKTMMKTGYVLLVDGD
jgi:hypothetical protein